MTKESSPREPKPGFRDFYDLELYEREKATRIMPQDLKQFNPYTLRLLWPFDTHPPGAEMLVAHIETIPEDEHFIVTFTRFSPKGNGEFEEAVMTFNSDGFLITFKDEDDSPNPPDEIEMGYILGSTDPVDVEFAHLAQQSQQPYLVEA